MTYYKIYTSYFSNINNLLKHNFTNLISIAGKCPDDFQFKQYRKLAPKYEWWKKWHDEKLSNDWYIQKYNETVLSKLDPQQVYFDLTEDKQNAVILCWEVPDLFCHRHLISKWLNENLKVNISCEVKLNENY